MKRSNTDTDARGKVILDVSMSLDGFIAASNDNAQHPLGNGGQRLHEWLFKDDAVDADALDGMVQSAGAVIIGRRTYDNAQGPDGWDGKGPLGEVPCFVLTHDVPKQAGAMFTFVTDGIESALNQAKIVAGDKGVGLLGANILQQYLNAGLVDELHIHLIPVLFGDGVRLFDHLGTEHIELERTRVVESVEVTHLRFRVVT